MRSNLRCLCQDRDIDMSDGAASAFYQRGCVLKEYPRICAAPLRVRWWEMNPNIAFTNRTKYCIGQRMHRSIGIRMPFECKGMIDACTKQRYAVACRESVNVKALADPNVREASKVFCGQQLIRLCDVGGRGELLVF